jgi:hypothetical protein
MTARFERLCLAAGLEALGGMLEAHVAARRFVALSAKHLEA